MKAQILNTQKYLQQIKVLETKIKQKKEEYIEVHNAALSVSAVRYDKEPIQCTKTGDTLERNVIRYLELENKIKADELEYYQLRNKIINEIQMLSDNRFVNILYKRYVEYKSYELISVEMNYSFDYTKELHRKSLIEFRKKHPTLSH